MRSHSAHLHYLVAAMLFIGALKALLFRGPPAIAQADTLIAAERDRVQECYQPELKDMEPLDVLSSIRVALHVSASGLVTDVNVNELVMRPGHSVVPCVRRVVSQWRFARGASAGIVIFNVFPANDGWHAATMETEISGTNALHL